MESCEKMGAAVAQRILLAAHGQWVLDLNPIRVTGGCQEAHPTTKCSCAPKKNQSLDQLRKKAQFRVSHRVWRQFFYWKIV